MGKRLCSVFTEDMEHCFFTGDSTCHRHHIFYGSRRKKSEEYGYVIPLAVYLHTFGDSSVHMNPNKGLDLTLKQMAQKHFEENHGNREDFIREFGKSYL